MRIFDHPNLSAPWQCPICRKDTDLPVALMPIPGTEEDGNVEAQQVHADCLQYWFAEVK